MAKLRVAGAQLPVGKDVTENLAAIHRALDYAVSERADVLLTPEGSLSGYTHQIDQVTAMWSGPITKAICCCAPKPARCGL